jgi:hypothetical protein
MYGDFEALSCFKIPEFFRFPATECMRAAHGGRPSGWLNRFSIPGIYKAFTMRLKNRM